MSSQRVSLTDLFGHAYCFACVCRGRQQLHLQHGAQRLAMQSAHSSDPIARSGLGRFFGLRFCQARLPLSISFSISILRQTVVYLHGKARPGRKDISSAVPRRYQHNRPINEFLLRFRSMSWPCSLPSGMDASF